MRKRLPQPQTIFNQNEQHGGSQQFITQPIEPQQVAFTVKLQPNSFAKDRIYLTFTGIIESGYVHEEDSLSLQFIIEASDHWKIINGQGQGISQVSSSFSSNSQKMVWNMPFEITFETTVFSGWPQIVFILQGSDFFGRSVIRAYGNLHLPCSPGQHHREVQLFKPLPQSLITQICGYLNGTISQYKHPEKVLSSGDGRQVTRTQSMGSLTLTVHTTRYNFNLFGYS